MDFRNTQAVFRGSINRTPMTNGKTPKKAVKSVPRQPLKKTTGTKKSIKYTPIKPDPTGLGSVKLGGAQKGVTKKTVKKLPRQVNKNVPKRLPPIKRNNNPMIKKAITPNTKQPPLKVVRLGGMPTDEKVIIPQKTVDVKGTVTTPNTPDIVTISSDAQKTNVAGMSFNPKLILIVGVVAILLYLINK